MTLKQTIGEEELVNITGNSGELIFTFRTEQWNSSLLTAM